MADTINENSPMTFEEFKQKYILTSHYIKQINSFMELERTQDKIEKFKDFLLHGKYNLYTLQFSDGNNPSTIW